MKTKTETVNSGIAKLNKATMAFVKAGGVIVQCRTRKVPKTSRQKCVARSSRGFVGSN